MNNPPKSYLFVKCNIDELSKVVNTILNHTFTVNKIDVTKPFALITASANHTNSDIYNRLKYINNITLWVRHSFSYVLKEKELFKELTQEWRTNTSEHVYDLLNNHVHGDSYFPDEWAPHVIHLINNIQ